MDRSVHKTIRISQESYDYIMGLSGDSWNDKFNQAIYDLMHGEEQRRVKLSRLEDQIKDREERLNKVVSLIKDAKNILGW